jgi:hypothetical protein
MQAPNQGLDGGEVAVFCKFFEYMKSDEICTYRFRRRAEANSFHDSDKGNRASLLQMESVSCDCRRRDVALHDAVETKPGAFEESGSAMVAAIELTLAAWLPGLWSGIVGNA